MHGDPATFDATAGRRPFIAAPWHTLSVLLIFGCFSFLDAMRARNAGLASATAVTHAAMLRGYIVSIFYEWGMAYWVWAGVHWKGGTLRDLTGGRWTSWRGVAVDVAIAIPFWIIWEFTAWLMLHLVERMKTATTPYQPPSGLLEVSFWILLSVSAGICEEIVFRGYLQQQFHAATRSMAAAVIIQGVCFGLVHVYQGWKHVIVIVALGVLYGMLVAWRRNLRASMIAHAWSDVFEGWLRSLWGV